MDNSNSETHQPEVVQQTWFRWLGPLIFLVAFGVRLVGIGWGLPNDLHNQSYHPDEQIIFAFSQQIEPTQLKFTPGFYNYGTLYLTVLRVASDVVAGYGGGPKQDNPGSVWTYMGACHKAGRLISAICGSLACVFVFLTLRRFAHPLGAVCGGLLLAFSPSFALHSRFQTVDVMATMLLAASLWFAVRLLDDPRVVRLALFAGVLAGLSTGTKYTGALALLSVLSAIALRKEEPWKAALTAVGGWFVAFVVATPGVLLDTEKFLRDFKFEMLHTSSGHGLVFEGVGSGFVYHITNMIQGLGPLAFLLAVAGLCWAASQKCKPILVLIAFALPYYVLIGRAEVLFARYTFPLLLVLAVGFGWIVSLSHERKKGWLALPAFGILSLGGALIINFGFTKWMISVDPRDSVARELKALPNATSSTIGLVSDPWFYSPALIPDVAIMRGQLKGQLDEMALAVPKVVRYIPENVSDRVDWDIRLLTSLKPDYVVFSNFEVGPVARLSDSQNPLPQVVRFKEFHAQLERDYEPTNGVNDASLRLRYASANLVEDMAYARPLIYIWKRKP